MSNDDNDEKVARNLAQQADIAELARSLRSGTMTRREFNRRLAALGIGAALAGTLAASPRAARATPKRGGRVRAAAGEHGPSDTLDPAKMVAIIDYCRGEQFYNGLTRINGALQAEPELAESWEPDAGGTQWVFRLRRGVEFHDGRSFGAEDVRYSLERHLDPKVGSVAKGFIENVEKIVVEDGHTVRFRLKGPDADFPVVLGLFQMKIVPNGYTDFATAIGTGPFKVAEFKPGIRSLGVRNSSYWDEGKPYVDEVEWFGIGDNLARLNALLAGDIHMMTGLDPKAIPRLASTSGVKAVNTKAGQFVDFAMMTDRAPTDNDDFRLAIKHLFDREAILKRIYEGNGMVGNDQPISPVDPMHCPTLPARPLDLDRARHLLKKAGMEGASVKLHTAEVAGTGAIEQALVLQSQAARIGLKIEIQRDPNDGYWSATWGKQPFFMSGWNMRPTANIMLTLAFQSSATINEAKWKNARFDELLIQGRSELDETRRREIYCEAQRLISDTGGVAIPCYFDYVDAMSERVQGFEPVPLGPLAAGQWPKFVWLDA
ncbi:MAG: ABC transporter substrate-binding protein [Gammaproteobacteria bacterium]|nr:ABC transporter substrate-binding protein [Gammaproteobacteria bacterium]